jgi:hypothetical protein
MSFIAKSLLFPNLPHKNRIFIACSTQADYGKIRMNSKLIQVKLENTLFLVIMCFHFCTSYQLIRDSRHISEDEIY